MLWHTHLAFGFLFGLLAMPYVRTGNIILYFAFVLLGSLLPDVDSPQSKINQKIGLTKIAAKLFAHRGVFHSIFGLIVIPGLFYLFVTQPIGIAVFVGYLSHLVADSLTLMGVNYFHPIATWHHRGFIETGTVAETVIFLGVVALSVWMVFF